MTQAQWTTVDDYLGGLVLPADAVLDEALKASEAAGLPAIAVSPLQGQLLFVLARAVAARRILEIGTLGGYSTICLARALPADGRLVSLEFEPKHAAVASANVARAGLADRVEIRVGRALDSLPALESEPPFDLVFIDADKPGYPDYWRWVLRLVRPGALVIADNVVRDGAVADAATTDPLVQGVRQYHALVAAEPRARATVIQTVGCKGYDGLSLAVIDGDASR